MKSEKPKSLILNGTNNNSKRHQYSFEKNEGFKEGFLELMENLGFGREKTDQFTIRNSSCDDEENVERIWIRKVSEVQDECWYFENKKYEIDVFFGVKKIIILFRIKGRNISRKRREMLDNLEESSDWISEEEKEKRLKERFEKLKKKAKIR